MIFARLDGLINTTAEKGKLNGTDFSRDTLPISKSSNTIIFALQSIQAIDPFFYTVPSAVFRFFAAVRGAIVDCLCGIVEFEAVCVTVQYQMDHGAGLFEV
jgi:hypothetical protein